MKNLVIEAREYLERTSEQLLKNFNAEIQSIDVREGLVVPMAPTMKLGAAADDIDANFDLDEPFQPPEEKQVYNGNDTIGFGNMTVGGPQVLGGGGDISAIGVNDTVDDLLGVMSKGKNQNSSLKRVAPPAAQKV